MGSGWVWGVYSVSGVIVNDADDGEGRVDKYGILTLPDILLLD